MNSLEDIVRKRNKRSVGRPIGPELLRDIIPDVMEDIRLRILARRTTEELHTQDSPVFFASPPEENTIN